MNLFGSFKLDDVGGSGVNNIGGQLDVTDLRTTLQYVKGDVTAPCWRIFNNLPIMADGQACICCQDVRGGVIVGNTVTQSIQEIWNGPTLNEIRAKFIMGLKSELHLCSACDYMLSFEKPEWWP